jgi:two-component system response regulator DegU
MVTVIIVDDHPVVRAGMRTVLDAAPGVTVVAEGANGADALGLVAQHQPDVLVLDVNLPDLNGLEVTQQLRLQDMATAILILTIHDDGQTVFGLVETVFRALHPSQTEDQSVCPCVAEARSSGSRLLW